MKINSPKSWFNSAKGFTLIELLIVIAIIGILAAALLYTLDPADKIKQSRDANAIDAVSKLASNIQQWAVQYNDGTYPTSLGAASSITGNPAAPTLANPTGYTITYTNTASSNSFILYIAPLTSKKYSANPRFLFDSATGTTCFGSNGATGGKTSCP